MEKKIDLRILKTYKALTTTFLQLLEKKRFEDITVNELCNLAMVRRATFYKHFADKYEFFIFVIRETQQQFYKENTITFGDERSKAFYLNLLRRTISFISENEKLIQSILQSNMTSSLLDILSEQISLDLKLKFKEDERNGALLIAHPEVLAHFFTGALMQTIRWWITQEHRISEEELIDQLLKILNDF